MVVVFPAPFGPRKATICPRGIENEISSIATNAPKYFVRPEASIMATDASSIMIQILSLEN
jgi:hypothetical protein